MSSDDWNRTREVLTGGFRHGEKLHSYKDWGRAIICPICPPGTRVEVVKP